MISINKELVRQFLLGVRKCIPVVLGYLSVGIAFGVIAKSSGLSAFETTFMSSSVFAGASQFIGVALLRDGVGFYPIVLSTLLVNSRHILMGASLSPYFRKFKTWSIALLSFGITDETFALNVTEFSGNHDRNEFFVAGVHLTAYIAWVISSLIGAYIGYMIADPQKFGLDFALPAMFICLLVLQLDTNLEFIVALISALLTISIYLLYPTSWSIMLASIGAATAGVCLKG